MMNVKRACRYNDLTVGGAAAAMQLGNGSAGLTSADDPVTRRFATAAASKFNLVRLFASQGSGGGALEPSPGDGGFGTSFVALRSLVRSMHTVFRPIEIWHSAPFYMHARCCVDAALTVIWRRRRTSPNRFGILTSWGGLLCMTTVWPPGKASQAPNFNRAIHQNTDPAGVFDEGVFRGIDYVLAQAARFGIRVIIALNNYFDDTDGVTNVRSIASIR